MFVSTPHRDASRVMEATLPQCLSLWLPFAAFEAAMRCSAPAKPPPSIDSARARPRGIIPPHLRSISLLILTATACACIAPTVLLDFTT